MIISYIKRISKLALIAMAIQTLQIMMIACLMHPPSEWGRWYGAGPSNQYDTPTLVIQHVYFGTYCERTAGLNNEVSGNFAYPQSMRTHVATCQSITWPSDEWDAYIEIGWPIPLASTFVGCRDLLRTDPGVWVAKYNSDIITSGAIKVPLSISSLGFVPTRLLWWNFISSVLVVMSLLAIMAAIMRRLKYWWRLRHEQCVKCGYNLSRCLIAKCPECGNEGCVEVPATGRLTGVNAPNPSE